MKVVYEKYCQCPEEGWLKNYFEMGCKDCKDLLLVLKSYHIFFIIQLLPEGPWMIWRKSREYTHFYKNIFYKNIEAKICKILRIY